MSEFLMPSLGSDMEGGTLVEWLKSPGDKVKHGDILAVVETVKGAIEIEAFEDGELERIVVEPGTEVAVGGLLAYIKEAAPGKSPKREKQPRSEPRAATAAAGKSDPAEPVATRHVSPAARKLASERGIDVAAVNAGPSGVVGLAEVEAFSRPTRKSGLDPDAMRQAIGAAMARSKREIPHYYVASTLDVSVFADWLDAENTRRGVSERLLYAAPLLKAVALALAAAPVLNGFYRDGRHQSADRVHVGFATAMRGGGLVAPAFHDADKPGLDEIMARLRDLVKRARSGRIRGSEMSDPTVTLSILGEDTADSLQPVIYPPQVSIIGCGAIRERPWTVNGEISTRKLMTVTVAGDHRVSDGRAAARFLNRLAAHLQEPETL